MRRRPFRENRSVRYERDRPPPRRDNRRVYHNGPVRTIVIEKRYGRINITLNKN